jgi:hypothetical protein
LFLKSGNMLLGALYLTRPALADPHARQRGLKAGDFGAEIGGVYWSEGHSKRATLVKIVRNSKIQPDIITESDTASASGAVRPRTARKVFGEILHYTYSLVVAVTPVGLHEYGGRHS